MNPTVAAEEAETWIGAGIVSSHTVSWRQNPGLPPPAVGSLFLLCLWPFCCFGGGSDTCLERGAAGDGRLRMQQLLEAAFQVGHTPFILSWKPSFKHNRVSQANQMGNWLECVGRWWRVWFTGYPRRFGTLLFQPSRIRMTKLQRSDPVRLVLLNVAMPQLSCTLYFLHISLQRQLAEEIWLRELGRDVRETVQVVLSLLLWKKKSLNPIFFLPSFLCPSLPCNFHLSAQILFSVHYAPDGLPSRWC